MRPEARLKCGFYPCPPDAVYHVVRYLLRPQDGQRFAMLDPCAGNGEALHILATELECDMQDVYACELDNARASVLHSTFDCFRSRVLAPADYFGTSAPAKSFSLIWCNPPFDDEYGGGSRVEREFLETATRHLKTRGILVLICPRNTALRHDIRNVFKCWYDSVYMIPFPDHCRRYNEVAVIAVKRDKMESYWNRNDRDVFLDKPFEYQIPTGVGPGNRFVKIQMTDEELERAFVTSPLNEMLKPPVVGHIDSPPLELSQGHLALLLASGHLDGLVCPPGEPPHVVRGTARKAEYVKETERSENQGGDVSYKTVVGEKIELIIRAVDYTGTIKTFTQSDRPAIPVPPTEPAPVIQPSRPQPVEPTPAPASVPVSHAPQPVLAGPGGREFDIN